MSNALLEDMSELQFRGVIDGVKVYGTRCRRFTVAPYRIASEPTADFMGDLVIEPVPGCFWALEVYRTGWDLTRPLVMLRAADMKHAQQLIAWFVWAEQKGRQ